MLQTARMSIDSDSTRSLQSYVAEEIRVLLLRQHLTAEQLGRQLGWSSSQTSRKLSSRSKLSLDDVYGIARALNVSLQSLLPTDTDYTWNLGLAA